MHEKGLTKVLIANRGEIAVRICRTLKEMGIASVAVYSDADRNSQHVSAADEAVALGGQTAAESYLRSELILQAAKDTGAQGIIPGYGFLSENADFAEACAEVGIQFIGPTPDQLRRFGLKHEARALAEAAGVPLAPGTGLLQSLDEAKGAAAEIGYPIMLKSTAGGAFQHDRVADFGGGAFRFVQALQQAGARRQRYAGGLRQGARFVLEAEAAQLIRGRADKLNADFGAGFGEVRVLR